MLHNRVSKPSSHISLLDVWKSSIPQPGQRNHGLLNGSFLRSQAFPMGSYSRSLASEINLLRLWNSHPQGSSMLRFGKGKDIDSFDKLDNSQPQVTPYARSTDYFVSSQLIQSRFEKANVISEALIKLWAELSASAVRHVVLFRRKSEALTVKFSRAESHAQTAGGLAIAMVRATTVLHRSTLSEGDQAPHGKYDIDMQTPHGAAKAVTKSIQNDASYSQILTGAALADREWRACIGSDKLWRTVGGQSKNEAACQPRLAKHCPMSLKASFTSVIGRSRGPRGIKLALLSERRRYVTKDTQGSLGGAAGNTLQTANRWAKLEKLMVEPSAAGAANQASIDGPCNASLSPLPASLPSHLHRTCILLSKASSLWQTEAGESSCTHVMLPMHNWLCRTPTSRSTGRVRRLRAWAPEHLHFAPQHPGSATRALLQRFLTLHSSSLSCCLFLYRLRALARDRPTPRRHMEFVVDFFCLLLKAIC
ncbi:uncharacterized protein BDR25DRAFT_353742 [Lindgomyces ingoldianus]|uniref:Uncharacterized protein n=1 Tax=Lindgomyces ingoldianus TaxID=673940 RepID=A0ACB6R0X7_9PLEO|nr:uncharacterized protein BDR25DRAFT_353742 [Lindgomyces ingoldianus]KAF2471982.1 hypothetical protein BDR25DRAFT_353742 [Lindgomyces ingoldianus]